MASYPEHMASGDDEEPEVLRRMDVVDDAFAEELESDARLQSGVPEGEFSSELEFIEMSGLRSEEEAPPANELDTDTSKPLSFYEKGIDDVDDDLAPYGEFNAPYPDEEMAADVLAPPPVTGLKDILSGLNRKSAQAPTANPESAPPEPPDFSEPPSEPFEAPAGETYPPDSRSDEAHIDAPAPQADGAGMADEPVAGFPPEADAYNAAAADFDDLLNLDDTSGKDTEPEAEVYGPVAEEQYEPESGAGQAESDEQVDLQGMLSQVRNEILEGIRDDIDNLDQVRGDAKPPPDAEGSADDSPIPEPEPPPEPLVDETAPPIADYSARGADVSPLSEADAFEEDISPGPRAEIPEPAKRERNMQARQKPVPELEEAERLIHELQHHRGHAQASSHEEPIDLDSLNDSDVPDVIVMEAEDEEADGDESIYRQEAAPHTRKGSRRRRRSRRLVKWGLVFAILCTAAISGWLIYQEVAPSLRKPEALFSQAQELERQGSYVRASGLYLDFVDRFPNDPRAPRALYQAAYVLQAVPPNVGGDHYNDSLSLMNRFLNEYPDNALTPRAEILLGVTHYRLRNYREAVDILQRNELRRHDYGAALPALRILAQAQAELGDYESARTELQKAATLPGNFSADQDYAEIAGLYADEAREAVSKTQKEEFFQEAIRYMQLAMRVPGIERARRNDLERQLNVLMEMANEEVPGAVRNYDGLGAAVLSPAAPALPLDSDFPVDDDRSMGPVTTPSSTPFMIQEERFDTDSDMNRDAEGVPAAEVDSAPSPAANTDTEASDGTESADNASGAGEAPE